MYEAVGNVNSTSLGYNTGPFSGSSLGYKFSAGYKPSLDTYTGLSTPCLSLSKKHPLISSRELTTSRAVKLLLLSEISRVL